MQRKLPGLEKSTKNPRKPIQFWSNPATLQRKRPGLEKSGERGRKCRIRRNGGQNTWATGLPGPNTWPIRDAPRRVQTLIRWHWRTKTKQHTHTHTHTLARHGTGVAQRDEKKSNEQKRLRRPAGGTRSESDPSTAATFYWMPSPPPRFLAFKINNTPRSSGPLKRSSTAAASSAASSATSSATSTWHLPLPPVLRSRPSSYSSSSSSLTQQDGEDRRIR